MLFSFGLVEMPSWGQGENLRLADVELDNYEIERGLVL